MLILLFFNLYLLKALDVLIVGATTVDKMDVNFLFLEQSSGGAAQEATHCRLLYGLRRPQTGRCDKGGRVCVHVCDLL